jgi:hypothetical protein
MIIASISMGWKKIMKHMEKVMCMILEQGFMIRGWGDG